MTVELERDGLGRIVKETTRATASEGEAIAGRAIAGGAVESGYRPDGARVRLRTSLGHRVEVRHDEHGEPVELESGEPLSPWRVGFERDAAGAELTRHLPGGAAQRWRYEPDGLPESRTVVAPSGAPVRRHEHGWDFGAQLRWLRVRDGEDRPAELLFKHDVRGRLEVMKGYDGRPHWRALDPAGNVHRDARAAEARYGPGGQLLDDGRGTTYAYDPLGRRTERRAIDPDGDAPLTDRYRWSDAGTLTAVERADGAEVRFVYDALRRRVAKTVTAPDGAARRTEWLWDGDVPVHERTDGEDLITWVWEPDTFAPLGRFVGRERTTILTDHLGAPAEGLTELGELAWTMQLDLFGVERIKGEGAKQIPWRWPGQYADDETGLYYNNFRYYDPSTGTYISEDPLGFEGGVHPYAYVADPFAWIDPLGLNGRSPVVAGEAGRFGDLDARRVAGDDLTPHHMPQAALHHTSRPDGGALVMSTAEHSRTRTFGARGRRTSRLDRTLPFRTALARDIRDVRRIVGSRYDDGLRALLQYYRDHFPDLLRRRGCGR